MPVRQRRKVQALPPRLIVRSAVSPIQAGGACGRRDHPCPVGPLRAAGSPVSTVAQLRRTWPHRRRAGVRRALPGVTRQRSHAARSSRPLGTQHLWVRIHGCPMSKSKRAPDSGLSCQDRRVSTSSRKSYSTWASCGTHADRLTSASTGTRNFAIPGRPSLSTGSLACRARLGRGLRPRLQQLRVPV